MNYEKSTTGVICMGGFLSVGAGLLFTINRAINDWFDLDFVDSLLMVFIFRAIFFFLVIFRQNSTGITSKI